MDVHPNEKVLRYRVYCIQQLLLPLLPLLLLFYYYYDHHYYWYYVYIYIYTYTCTYMCITCFTAPPQCFQVFYLCTFHRSCARFTSPLITFVFNCIHTERILISKSIGATKHVLLIYIYICMHVCMYACMYVRTYVVTLLISIYIYNYVCVRVCSFI